MIDERIQNIVQLNQNVDFISQPEQYLKYIKRYKNKLQSIDIQNIYDNLSYIDIQLLNSRYNTSHTTEIISEFNTITTSAIAEMKQFNDIYQNINSSKFQNAGINNFINCKIQNFEMICVDYSIRYLDLYDMTDYMTYDMLKYPISVLVAKRALVSLERVPNYFSNPILLSELRSSDIQLQYNEAYTYRISFLYKTQVIGNSQTFFQISLYTAQTDTFPLTFSEYHRVDLSNEFALYSTQFIPAPLVDDITKSKVKFSIFLNRNTFKNNNIVLYITNINIQVLK